MSNQTAAAVAAIANAVNWERQGLSLQAIIEASNRGFLGKPLTDWLASKGWNQGKFVVKHHFKVGGAKVKISRIGSNFQNWFSNCIENLTPPVAKLIPVTLTKASSDSDIIDGLGGIARAISSLGEMFALMERQPEGQIGPLLINITANIAYVPQPVKRLSDKKFSYTDVGGVEIFEEVQDSKHLFELKGQWCVLRAVNAVWDDDGWNINAYHIETLTGWNTGGQVFSRNSVLESSEPVSAAS